MLITTSPFMLRLASLVSEIFMHISVHQGHSIVETINQNNKGTGVSNSNTQWAEIKKLL